MGFINKIWSRRWMLRALLPSVWFNFRHLPFAQACKLPILIYKGKMSNARGQFIIKGEARFGMIRLGVDSVSIFPNNGIMIENRGTIIFHGQTQIGNNSAISLGHGATLELGENFSATTGFRIACYDSVKFDHDVLIGWNTLWTDTDFHALKNAHTGKLHDGGYGPISVGHDVWIANGCKIYKNVSIPPLCVVGADTILHKPVECEPYTIITNKIETTVVTKGLYLDYKDNKINHKA